MSHFDLTEEELDRIDEAVDRLRVWSESDEGKASILDASQRCAKSRERRRQERHMLWRAFYEPITI